MAFFLNSVIWHQRATRLRPCPTYSSQWHALEYRKVDVISNIDVETCAGQRWYPPLGVMTMGTFTGHINRGDAAAKALCWAHRVVESRSVASVAPEREALTFLGNCQSHRLIITVNFNEDLQYFCVYVANTCYSVSLPLLFTEQENITGERTVWRRLFRFIERSVCVSGRKW